MCYDRVTRVQGVFKITLKLKIRISGCGQGGLILHRHLDEVPEEGVRVPGRGFELGMELAAHEPGVVTELYHLDEVPVGGEPAQDEPVFV